MQLFTLLLFALLSQVTLAVQYPTQVGKIVSKMTQLTQQALQARISRMEIELPPIADFGVEAASKKSTKDLSQTEKIAKTNREAARLFAEMFSSISSASTVLLPNEKDALTARNLWGATFRGNVLSMDVKGTKGYGKLRSRKFSAEEQEQALLSTDGFYIPDGTEVLIISGPRLKDWPKIRKISSKLGDGTLIIVLNGRASASASKTKTSTRETTTENSDSEESPDDLMSWLGSTFVQVFHYAPPTLPDDVTKDRELLLYKEYNNNWFLAEKEANAGFLGGMIGGGGSFKTLWEGANRPTVAELIKVLGP